MYLPFCLINQDLKRFYRRKGILFISNCI